MKRILILVFAIIVASFSVSSCFLFGSGSGSGSQGSNHPMVGTWSASSWSFSINSNGTADVVIGGDRVSCEWEEIDSRQGIVVGPCHREYFIISPSGTLYATNLKTGSRTSLIKLSRR